ncbi:DUF1566 domain-containing protein [Aliivibrio logei]|uniref:BIG2 domain-containing protein n=1 Tax=Aliivibrio logei 5S-186 TaxID=626086 RepID=A0ABX3ATH8_ALILO|nr:DUF1566 domain-containing protein [Aliivibrio logei]OEF11838.1 hypothetical protein A1Q5_09855 [Aliivibrio logei 5S-186]
MFLDNVRLAILIVATMLLLACRSEGVFSDSNSVLLPKSSPYQVTPSLYQIDIINNPLNIYIPMKYSAMGKYDDGTEVDVSSSVHWVAFTPEIVNFDATGVASPKQVGSTLVIAELDGITSDAVELNIVSSMVCGHIVGTSINKEANGGINNIGKDNAMGECLKVREVTHNEKIKYFTAVPSFDMVTLISENIDDIRFDPEIDEFGSQSRFANFSWEQGITWCDHLSDINFMSKSNWKMASIDELDSLFYYENSNGSNSLLDLYGWPIRILYWTEDKGEFENTRMTYGLSNSYPRDFNMEPHLSSSFYVSCVVSI